MDYILIFKNKYFIMCYPTQEVKTTLSVYRLTQTRKNIDCWCVIKQSTKIVHVQGKQERAC